jgi:sigma-B regulation protein RsbU (phosphoserine phosphatase)
MLVTGVTERETLATLFDLGRRITSVLNFEELLQTIPNLIGRLIDFDAFAVYLLDEKRGELHIAYEQGYPPGVAGNVVVKLGEGIVGAAVAEHRAWLVNDLSEEPRYLRFVPDARSSIVVPLLYQKRAIGALNILNRELHAFTERDMVIVRQFAAHVAVALENARLFAEQREVAAVFESLAEIGGQVASILDLDELVKRIGQFVKRVIDYRSFCLLLLNDQTGMLEVRQAIQYGEVSDLPPVKLGDGLVGYAALHQEPVLVPNVNEDPRYIRIVEDVESEVAVPLIYKDRCIGVLDLASPDRGAFEKQHVHLLQVLASQVAVAIENAKLYAAVVANEERLEKELRFAQRVQAALLPSGLPKRMRGVDVGARFAPARELGGDFHDFLAPEANSLVVAVGDVSGKGVPAALYSVFAAELVRSRTFRKRYMPERSTPAGVLASINIILNQRQLEEYYCTLCYAVFDFKRRTVTMANSGLPYPLHLTGDEVRRIELPGLPVGSFAGSEYEEVVIPLSAGDIFVFCSDGVFEATNEAGDEFAWPRLAEVLRQGRQLSADALVDAIFGAVHTFRGMGPQTDDMTAVAVKILS